MKNKDYETNWIILKAMAEKAVQIGNMKITSKELLKLMEDIENADTDDDDL